jgi:hypothetical protein
MSSVALRLLRGAGLLLTLWASAARADIYGFVDDEGVTHFSTEPVDARYTLFFREGEHANDVKRTATPVADAALMQTRLFQRVVEQPNVARFEPLIASVAREQGQDPALLKSMIAVESGFEPDAVSSKGAVGLMQVLPETAERYGLSADRHKTVAQKLCEPQTNLRIGARYMKDLRAMFGNLPLALAAYNAGENSVKRFNNAIPPFPETVSYVKVVQQFLAFYQPTRSPYLNTGRMHIILPARRNMPESITGEHAPLIIPEGIADTVSIKTIP